MHPLLVPPLAISDGGVPPRARVCMCASARCRTAPSLSSSSAPPRAPAPAPLPRSPAITPASPTLAGSPRPQPWFSDTRPYPTSADLLHAATAMLSSARWPQRAQGAAAPPCTLAGQLHPATTSHARSAWTPPPEPTPPRAPPRHRLRPSAGSAVSPGPGGGRAPRAHTSHTQTPATSCAKSHTLSHTLCIPGPHTSRGSSCLHPQRCLSWDLVRGEKTPALGGRPLSLS